MKKIVVFIYLVLLASISLFAQQTPNYRPSFHYSPPKNWVNDPNGLVYLDGEYHLFYQYNPFGEKWGHMSWGHAVSRDLKTWKTLPLAIPEFDNADGTKTMIFSGCAVVDSLNTSGFFKKEFKKGLVAVFTSHIEGKAQHQSLAYSSDKGRTWKRYDQNPVLDIGLKDFRDPNIIWYPERQVWIMSLVKPLDYLVQFYESKDLKNWNLLSEFGKQGDITRIWECPSLVKVPVENSQESKWVVMLSSGHRQSNYLAVQYFVGDFDGKIFTPQKQAEILYVDEGKDFYASIPFYNLPKTHKKPVMIGWLNDWEYANDIPTVGFRGAFSVAREMSLFQENGLYKLQQNPIVKSNVITEKISLKSGDKLNSKLSKNNTNSYRLQLIINLLNSKGFDLELLKNGVNSSILSYDVATETLSFDRTKSGNVDFHKRFSSIESVKISPEKNQLKLDILVDKSVVEIYANDGKAVMTDLVFPLKNTSSIELRWK
jgi:fructan beta-fructosidase